MIGLAIRRRALLTVVRRLVCIAERLRWELELHRRFAPTLRRPIRNGDPEQV